MPTISYDPRASVRTDRWNEAPNPTSAPAMGIPRGSLTTPWIRTPGSSARSSRARSPARSSTLFDAGAAASRRHVHREKTGRQVLEHEATGDVRAPSTLLDPPAVPADHQGTLDR